MIDMFAIPTCGDTIGDLMFLLVHVYEAYDDVGSLRVRLADALSVKLIFASKCFRESRMRCAMGSIVVGG